VAFISAVFEFTYFHDNTEFVDLGWGLLGLILVIRNSFRIKFENIGQFFISIAILSLIVIYSIRHVIIYFRNFKGLDKKHLNFRYKEIEEKFSNNRIGYWIFNYLCLHIMPISCLAHSFFPIFEILEGSKRSYNIGLLVISYLLSYFAIIMETVSDEQLFIFRMNRSPGNLVQKTGLWKRIRHPNYLGEILYFLSLFLINYSFTNSIGWNIVGFILILSIFIFYSIPAMEKHLLEKYREEYEEYRKNTYRLFPLVY
jgi:steroid 5-alpha reductase family enzyme